MTRSSFRFFFPPPRRLRTHSLGGFGLFRPPAVLQRLAHGQKDATDETTGLQGARDESDPALAELEGADHRQRRTRGSLVIPMVPSSRSRVDRQ